MNLRVLAHYKDGSTKIFDDGTDQMEHNQLTSLQLQSNMEEIWTLSARNKEKAVFRQRDFKKEGKVLARSILKKLGKNYWVDLSVECLTNRTTINILEEA